MPKKNEVNNECYHDLNERWYTAQDDPVALLRAEAKLHVPWIQEVLLSHGKENSRLLDMGCGGGFLTNKLIHMGHEVTGIDLSEESLLIAKKYDTTGKVAYLQADAMKTEFPDNSFDVVLAMDLLEHVEDVPAVIKEASRVLKPGGLFFFHTFNRNILSHLIIIKCVEWFVKNTPKNLHVPHMFIKPKEIKSFCLQAGLSTKIMQGQRPKFTLPSLLNLLFKNKVHPNFEFKFSPSLLLSYSGMAQKV